MRETNVPTVPHHCLHDRFWKYWVIGLLLVERLVERDRGLLPSARARIGFAVIEAASLGGMALAFAMGG